MFSQICKSAVIKYRYMLSARKSDVIGYRDGKIVCDYSLMDEGMSNIECLVIVNNKLNLFWLEKALNCCDNVVLADGGANQFYNTPFRDSEKVRAIVGDFDSLKPNVRNFYDKRGVQITQVWNQDTNDFEKAVKKSISKGWNKIFCFGAFGGRMDHTLSSMHHAQKLSKQHQKLSICLIGQTNMMYYLRPNVTHQITISDSIEKKCCGLIPFGNADYVSTKGFKWNLGPNYFRSSLKWGEFISTSNEIQGDTVQIQSSHSLFFVSHFKNPSEE